MNDMERAVEPFQAADGAQPGGEDAALAVLDGQDRTANDARSVARLRRGLADVHRAVGCHDNGCRIAETGCPGRELNRPARRRLRQEFPLRFSSRTASDLKGHDESENRYEAGTHEFPLPGQPGAEPSPLRARSANVVEVASRNQPDAPDGLVKRPPVDQNTSCSWGGAFYRPFPFVSM